MPSPLLVVGSPQTDALGHARICDDLLHPAGAPRLAMYGKMQGGVPWTVHLDHGLPGNQAWLVFGLSAISAPFKGGVLVPAVNLLLPVALDGAGLFEAGATTPASVDPQPRALAPGMDARRGGHRGLVGDAGAALALRSARRWAVRREDLAGRRLLFRNPCDRLRAEAPSPSPRVLP